MNKRKLSAPVFALALLLCCLGHVGPVLADPASEASEAAAVAQQNERVLDAVLDRIRKSFYDKTFGGHDLEEMRGRYLARVQASDPGVPLHKVISEMLAEFKVSHLAIVEEEVYTDYFAPEMNNTRSLRYGFDVVQLEYGYFVSDVAAGGPAEKAGLLRGDCLTTIDEVPVADSPLLLDAGGDPGLPGHPHFVVKVASEFVKLAVRRERTSDETTEVTVCAESMNMIEACRSSVSVIEHEGKKYGYIRFYHFLHMGMASALRSAIRNEWKDCDGAIVDLRGRGGSPQVMNSCFEPFGTPPRPSGGWFFGRGPRMPKWDRPVVCLQDGGSRSAKEVYAHNWRYLEVGPIVGETSPGAVLGSSFFDLPDGSRLLLPLQRAGGLTWGYTDLEGNGVPPTHPVKDHLPFAQGRDTIREAGIKVLHELAGEMPE